MCGLKYTYNTCPSIINTTYTIQLFSPLEERGPPKLWSQDKHCRYRILHGNNGLHRAYDHMCKEFSLLFDTPSPSTCKTVLCTLTVVLEYMWVSWDYISDTVYTIVIGYVCLCNGQWRAWKFDKLGNTMGWSLWYRSKHAHSDSES